MEEKWYQPHEFGRIVGMTKRALRYYREKELLIPDHITEEGHTFYSENNLFQAQQISTLRYLGFSVEQIKEMQQKQVSVTSSLALQKNLLQDRIIEMRRVITAIETMEETIKKKDRVSWNTMFDTVKYAKREAVENSMMAYYENRAEEYDDIFTGGGPASCKPGVYKRDIAALWRLLADFGGEKAIDIACGTAYWLQGYYKNCREFTFLDAAPSMLRKCKERVKSLGLLECSSFLNEDFLRWEKFIPHQYDCAVVGFLLGHFMTMQEVEFFAKLKALLKPKGKVLLIDNAWTKLRAAEEHKEDIEKRRLSDGREFSIYKKYFEEEEIRGILATN